MYNIFRSLSSHDQQRNDFNGISEIIEYEHHRIEIWRSITLNVSSSMVTYIEQYSLWNGLLTFVFEEWIADIVVVKNDVHTLLYRYLFQKFRIINFDLYHALT